MVCYGLILSNSTHKFHHHFNLSPQGQNDRHLVDDIIKCISLNEKLCILITISLNFVSKGLIDNKAAFDQVMAWRRTGDKTLPEPMLIQFLDAYMRHQGEMS